MFLATLLLQGLCPIYIGGVDTSLVYARNFERTILTPFSNMPTVFEKELLFYYLTKVFTSIYTDFHVYVFGFRKLFYIYIAYPIAEVKINFKQWIVIIAIVVAVFLAKARVAGLVNSVIIGMDRYSRYSTSTSQLSLMGVMILICIYVVSFIFSYPLYKDDDELKMLLNMSVVSIAFMTMVTIVGEFHRISMFFGIYNTVLLPKAWKMYRVEDRRLKAVYLLGMAAVFVAYFLLIGLNNYDLAMYRFFWTD